MLLLVLLLVQSGCLCFCRWFAFAIGAEMVALGLWGNVVITLISLGCCCALCVAVGGIIVCAVIGSCPCWPSVLCSDFRLLFFSVLHVVPLSLWLRSVVLWGSELQ